jgi:uroporphyrinogen decarboxylase
MNKRDVINQVLEGKQPPYVPWSFGFTKEARDKLLNTIADYNIAQIQQALSYEIDAVYFGDDWGRLTSHGGLSTQRTLPYGTVADVRRETEGLLAAGRLGSYLLAPAHE